MAKNVKTVKNEKMKKSLQKKIKKGFIAVARLTLKPGASLRSEVMNRIRDSNILKKIKRHLGKKRK